MPLPDHTKETIKSSLDSVTSNPSTGVSGLVFVAADKNGDVLAEHASGTKGLNTKEPMTLDTIFWIASCTKMLVGIACMQLVEQGKIPLDDHEALYKVCPELKEKQVLDENAKLVDRKGEITLRMLLNHTAGFGYTFFNHRLLEYSRPAGFDEFMGDREDIMDMPLVNQPGTAWEYGVSGIARLFSDW